MDVAGKHKAGQRIENFESGYWDGEEQKKATEGNVFAYKRFLKFDADTVDMC